MLQMHDWELFLFAESLLKREKRTEASLCMVTYIMTCGAAVRVQTQTNLELFNDVFSG